MGHGTAAAVILCSLPASLLAGPPDEPGKKVRPPAGLGPPECRTIGSPMVDAVGP